MKTFFIASSLYNVFANILISSASFPLADLDWATWETVLHSVAWTSCGFCITCVRFTVFPLVLYTFLVVFWVYSVYFGTPYLLHTFDRQNKYFVQICKVHLKNKKEYDGKVRTLINVIFVDSRLNITPNSSY